MELNLVCFFLWKEKQQQQNKLEMCKSGLFDIIFLC